MTTRKFTGLERELHERAIRETGFNDFGEPSYREGLSVLLAAYDIDVQPTEVGWRLIYDEVLRTLVARLYTQRGWAEHPEVLTARIRRPLVITGCPRTGTTALHKLLSVDTQFQGLEHWLTEAPMVRPPRGTWETYPAYRDCVARLGAHYTISPEVRKAHEMVADEVDECWLVLCQSFVSNAFSMDIWLPTYDRWYFKQSRRESYRRYVDVLRLIGASEPQKRWLLKNPLFITEIDTLLEVLPDACIVQTHRDPLKAIPSLCSLAHMSLPTLEIGRAEVIGPRACAFFRKGLDRIESARQRAPAQFFDVDHRRFLADPLGAVRSIYEHFGLTLSPHTEEQMRVWVAAPPTTRHGKHRYAIDPYGITEAQIRSIFADYRAQYCFE